MHTRCRPLALACACLALLGAAPAAAQHPHLYFDAAGLTAIKQRASDAQSRGDWSFKQLYDELVAQGEAALGKRFSYTVAIPDADGQGSVSWRYELSSAPPPPHPNNPSYPPWTILSRQLQAQMELLALLYAIAGDARFLRDAAGAGAVDLALAVSAWPSWTDSGYSCGKACLDTAHLTMGAALVYDLAYEALSAAERTAIRGALISKGIFPLAAEVTTSGAPHNIHALRATGLAVGGAAVHSESGATPHLQKAHAGLLHFIASQGKDGGALEGHTYGAYAMDTIVRGALALERKSTLAPLLDHPWAQGLPRFAAAFLGTDLTQAPFGDSSAAGYWHTTMYALATRGHGEAQWYLERLWQGRPLGWFPFALARGTAATPLAAPGGALYPDTGYAALRDGFDAAPMLAMKSGPPSASVGHNHLDHNSFVISAFGEWLAADPGYRDYFNAPRRNYTTGSVGHNTLLVGGSVSADGVTVRGGQSALAGGQLRNLWQGAAYSRVIGDAAATYPAGVLERFTRRAYYARPELFFVLDEVRATSAAELSLLLHTHPGAVAERLPGTGGQLPAYRAAGAHGALLSFAVSSAGWQADAPRVRPFPGTFGLAPYAEWRTPATRALAAITALVPVARPREAILNPGFEEGLRGWRPRSAAEDVVVESAQHSGARAGCVKRAGGTGYFYSSAIATAPGRTIAGSAWVQASGTGKVRLLPYFLRGTKFLDPPDGTPLDRDAAGLASWTELALPEQQAPAGADGVLLALIFEGQGQACFDDAALSSTPPLAGAEREPTAFALGDPPAGLAVESVHGLDAALSFLGDARKPADTPLVGRGSRALTVHSDAQLALVGLDAAGALRRAYLQDGTWLRVDGSELVRSSKAGGYDLRRVEDGGCVRLHVAQVPTAAGAPFVVRATADEVLLDGARVAFAAEDGLLRLPVAGEPQKCVPRPPAADGGIAGDGMALLRDGGPRGDGASGGAAGASGGCACQNAGAAAPAWLLLALLGGGLTARAWRRGRSRRCR